MALPRCIQYESSSTAAALDLDERHDGSPFLQVRKEQAQRRLYADGMMNAMYRPKYVCWECRRTFKPTVCEGKRIVHTGQSDVHKIRETTSGQLYVAPRRYQSANEAVRAHPAEKEAAIFYRQPSSDPREQTVWAVQELPPATNTRQASHASSSQRHQGPPLPKGSVSRRTSTQIRYDQALSNEIDRLYQPIQGGSSATATSGEEDGFESASDRLAARDALQASSLPPRIVVTCCPSCGTIGSRIGSNFRAPPHKDTKAWAEARRRTEEEGEHWTFCMDAERVGWMAELVRLVRARRNAEQAAAAATAADGEAGMRRAARRDPYHISGKDRLREDELRRKLGLMDTDIALNDLSL
ncbi:hypothetical protein OC835_002979 [Tilletia horrida]|nr:hypothetical protein OC835_002979 [Tilletia horrida]